uniref:Reverse transcriptase domain-containing protein n=1 Tax=Angiostrongylus cantonensis TaxID=6313 RepID=A0A0K0DIK2_ANGCA
MSVTEIVIFNIGMLFSILAHCCAWAIHIQVLERLKDCDDNMKSASKLVENSSISESVMQLSAEQLRFDPDVNEFERDVAVLMLKDIICVTHVPKAVMDSIDVSALYTNVSNDSAMQAIRELLEQHEGAINIWSEKYYAQIRGLAMGQRLALTLAVAFVYKVEAPLIDLRQLLYCRYIDDCFVICSTQKEMAFIPKRPN